MRLNHVNLTVSDLERSAIFYETHFGFDTRVHDEDDFVMLSKPDGSLLALMPGAPPDNAMEAFHFGFQLAGPDEVRAARERFREAGVPELEWQQEGGFALVRVTDPDGYGVELFSA